MNTECAATASKRRVTKTIGWMGALAVMLGAGVGVAALGTGTANADCGTGTAASAPGFIDCDGIQHGQFSPSTMGATDGQDSVDGQGVEDYAPCAFHGRACTGVPQVDGSGTYVSRQEVEDYDGTQGEFCRARPGKPNVGVGVASVPICA